MVQDTIWLRKVIIQMLNTESSPLCVSIRYLNKLFSFSKAGIYLRELSDSSDQDTKLIYVESGKACMYPVPEYDQEKLSDLIANVLKARRALPFGNGIAVPMRCSVAADFGVLFMETENTEWDRQKQEAVESFSELIYRNAMGGFLMNCHPTVLEVRDITAKYDLKNPDAPNILNNCSFEVNAGELTVIMGPSGGGKSTLLNIIAGLLKPVSGEVLWDGKDICSMNRREIDSYHRDALGFIFQNYILISDLSAKENVAIAAALCPTPKDSEQVLKDLGLGQLIHSRSRQMSGGEQQRVCIARALVKNPKILLCDEPTGALDTENTKYIMSILQKIAKEQNIPVVVVTHNPDFVILADHYIYIRDGRIEKDYYQPFPFLAEEVL